MQPKNLNGIRLREMMQKTGIILLLVFNSCVKDKPVKSPPTAVTFSSSKKVYIINEGPFQSGNGSISLYDVETTHVIENYYKTQNNSEIGNIAQSLSFVNGKFYIVVNNSKKIIVCDSELKKTGEIKELNSPRYILPITNQKAYVSDLYANAISIVDLNLNTKIGSIPCSGKTEKMTLIYNKAFVTNSDREYVYIINTINDLKTDSVFVGKNAGSIILDKNDKIWVLSSGNLQNSVAKLTRINAITNQIESAMSFAQSDYPNNLCTNKTKDTLYFLNDGIFRMSISDNSFPTNPLIAKGNRNFYGLGINPNNYTIYAADALDYSQKSNIYIFDVNGNQKNLFKAGIISNGFYFE